MAPRTPARSSVARVAAVVATLAVVATAGGAPGQAAGPVPVDPPIVVEDGLTQPIYDEILTERVWVETPLDTDADGELDRVVADVARPAATDDGLRVPVVLEASPYRSGTWNDVPYHTDLDPQVLPQSSAAGGSSLAQRLSASPSASASPNLPGSLDDQFVPRGYAVVLAQSVGTADSDGCPTTGDPAETASARAVVDWLGGRARAFDAAGPGGEEVEATWTTGDVGMTGASYNGTLPNQVAALGDAVPNLRTIVPVVAISDWYGYYRENGLVVAPGGYQGEDADILAGFVAGEERALGQCADEIAALEVDQDRVTGDYNAFWDERNYLDDAAEVTASVFVVDGRNDWNVKPLQYGRWWDALAQNGNERKIWLTNRGHGSPGNASYTLPSGRTWTYAQTLQRWFDHELWGVDNGIDAEPRAILEREDGVTTTYPDWPLPGARDVRMRLGTGAESSSGTGPGTLTTRAPAGRDQYSTLTDDGRARAAASLIAGPDAVDPGRLAFLTEPFADGAHLSGTPRVDLRVAVENTDAANLTAYLVDYAPDGAATMVTRGWMDVQNHDGREVTTPITPGERYSYAFDLHPDDYVVPPGHRLGLVVFSTDQEFTLRPDPGTVLGVDARRSSVVLPLVG